MRALSVRGLGLCPDSRSETVSALLGNSSLFACSAFLGARNFLPGRCFLPGRGLLGNLLFHFTLGDFLLHLAFGSGSFLFDFTLGDFLLHFALGSCRFFLHYSFLGDFACNGSFLRCNFFLGRALLRSGLSFRRSFLLRNGFLSRSHVCLRVRVSANEYIQEYSKFQQLL